MKRTLKIAIALIILINLIVSPLAQCVYAVSSDMIQETENSNQMTTDESIAERQSTENAKVGENLDENIETDEEKQKDKTEIEVEQESQSDNK